VHNSVFYLKLRLTVKAYDLSVLYTNNYDWSAIKTDSDVHVHYYQLTCTFLFYQMSLFDMHAVKPLFKGYFKH
jgi:hypothetical protein